MNPKNIRPSVMDMAHHARGALLMGCGGGGDIIQTIPMMNYLRNLGVERFVLGDYAIKWWDSAGRISMGGEILDLDWLKPADRIHPDAALVYADTIVQAGLGKGQTIHEAVIKRLFDVPTVSISLADGVPGVVSALQAVMQRFDLSILFMVDIGSDTFYSGEETTVQSPLADAVSIAAAVELKGVLALSGYGCDAEMPLFHLDRNVARVMQSGGYLGAYGLTPQDVADLSLLLEEFPNETVEQWPRDAALGKLGTQFCKGWWPIEVTPLAAVTLFFDPESICQVNPLPDAIQHTRSLVEVEEILLSRFHICPETRLPLLVEVPTPPQIPAH